MLENNPLVSIIIPTYSRPQYLARAVESALNAAPNGDVEVIVVPNGGDKSWKKSLSSLLEDSRIIVSPIIKGHANSARNHGLSIAKGKYIRFLDDDDYFFIEGALKQVELIEQTGAEICGGSLAVVNADGNLLNILNMKYAPDFVSHLVSPQGRTSPQFYIYRRQSLVGLYWDESINIGQDTSWTHNMCRMKDWSWVAIKEPVCTWVQHSENQISNQYNKLRHAKLQLTYKLETLQSLIQQDRLTYNRQEKAIEGIWAIIHNSFFLAPIYWTKVIINFNKKYPNTFPKIGLYNSNFGKYISPILVEWLMVPKRWLNFIFRRFLIYIGKKSNWV